jgi:hypothetical protein
MEQIQGRMVLGLQHPSSRPDLGCLLQLRVCRDEQAAHLFSRSGSLDPRADEFLNNNWRAKQQLIQCHARILDRGLWPRRTPRSISLRDLWHLSPLVPD